jgi:hypothetical protein
MLVVFVQAEVTMHIELTEDEVVTLREALTCWLGDLSVEIRHTDDPAFRSGLRARRDSLRSVRDRLSMAA